MNHYSSATMNLDSINSIVWMFGGSDKKWPVTIEGKFSWGINYISAIVRFYYIILLPTNAQNKSHFTLQIGLKSHKMQEEQQRMKLKHAQCATNCLLFIKICLLAIRNTVLTLTTSASIDAYCISCISFIYLVKKYFWNKINN